MLFPPVACFISTSTTSESFLSTVSDAFSSSRLLYLSLHYIGKASCSPFPMLFLQPLALSQPPLHRKSFLLTVSDAFSSSRLLYLNLHYIGKVSCSPFPMLFPPTACFISTSTTSEKLPVHRFRCFFLQPLALSRPPPHRKSFLSTDSDAFSSSRLLYLNLHYIGKASCPPIPMLFPPTGGIELGIEEGAGIITDNCAFLLVH